MSNIQFRLVGCMTASAMVLYYYSEIINNYILEFDGYGLLPLNNGLSVNVVLNNIIVGFKFLAVYALGLWCCTAILGIAVYFLFTNFRVSKSSGE